MTVLLVHGVPEGPAVWDSLRRALGRDDVLTPALPGFTCPRPDGFGATKEEYVDWLTGEVEEVGEPVDLVGHDWGGGLVVRLVSLRPELVRSWVTDAAGIADEGFEWHELARVWQTPGAGEEFFEQVLAMPVEQRAAGFTALGIPSEGAHAIAAGVDVTMAGCILDLYRSAVEVAQQWSPSFKDVPKRGLAIVASEDPYLPAAGGRAGAARAGAQLVELDGLGHWWMLEDPERGAEVLRRFWAGLG